MTEKNDISLQLKKKFIGRDSNPHLRITCKRRIIVITAVNNLLTAPAYRG
jgi:hypothetical protein